MINLDDLKPILSDILGEREDTASIIERITAIDKPIEPQSTDAQAQIDALNASWEKRFRDTFFKPAEPNKAPETKQYDNPAGAETNVNAETTNFTFDALFTKGDGE